MQITDRYREMMALLPDDVDLDEEMHGAPPEDYIVGAAAHLGWAVPEAALDLRLTIEELVERYG